MAKRGRARAARMCMGIIAIAMAHPARPADGASTIDIPRASAAPRIDGRLDDPTWRAAVRVSDFTQVDPVAGAPPSEATEIYLAYDSDHVYVGIRCLDRDPGAIIARRLRDDDELFRDDSIFVAFDSLRDRRNAFLFVVNPRGTKRDVRIENNVIYRAEWDGIWDAQARIDAQGWAAEMAIPVKTLNFDPAAKTWGLNISRMIRRRNEWVRWTNISQDRDFADVAAFGELRGLEGLDQGVGLELRPALAIRHRRDYGSAETDLNLRPGGELVYKLTPALNASLILTPDFSDTRVDEVQTNLTRFALLFPEQRDFFVRDADIFEFGGMREVNGIPFFSRRIGLAGDTENPETIPLDIGGKLSGRVGRYTLGMLSTQMGAFGAVDGRNLSVVRAAADMFQESRAGMIMTWGDPARESDNGVVGFDYRFRDSNLLPGRVFVADAFFMRSYTPGIDDENSAYGLRLNYPNDRWNAVANFTVIEDNFNPALGFVNRSAIRQYDGELRYRWRPVDSALVRRLDFGVQWDLVTDLDGDLESGRLSASLLRGESQAGDKIEIWADRLHETLNEPFEIQRGVVLAPGGYDWSGMYGKLETAPDRRLSAEIEAIVGEFYDGERIDVRGKLIFRPIPQFTLGLERRDFNINLPAGDFDVEINRLLVAFYPSPRVAWTNFLQHETETHAMTLNSQLRWIVRPGYELWLTFNHDWARQEGHYRSRDGDFTTKIFWTGRW